MQESKHGLEPESSQTMTVQTPLKSKLRPSPSSKKIKKVKVLKDKTKKRKKLRPQVRQAGQSVAPRPSESG